jgi:predicted kinase
MKISEINNSPNNPKLFVLVGVPGSGKSTYIKNVISKELADYVIVSSDDILERIATEKNKTYSEIFNDYIKVATRESNELFFNAVKNNLSIIIDKTSMSVPSRKKWIQACGNKYYKIAVVFKIDDKELESRLLARAKNTGKKIPLAVVRDMEQRFEMPSYAEGFNEIRRG